MEYGNTGFDWCFQDVFKLMKAILIILFVSSFIFKSQSATLYCGPVSAGGGTGADFSNRMVLPDDEEFVRGNVYVVIGSGTSYGNKLLGTANSGTTTITIRAANAAQDNGVAGWSSTFESTLITMGNVRVHSQYWIIDGVSRVESDGWSSPVGRYRIRATAILADSVANSDDADNSQFRYIDIGDAYDESPSDPTIASYGSPIEMKYNQQNITFYKCALHNGIHALAQCAGANNMTFDSCDIGPGWCKASLRGGNGSTSSDWTIRYCRFWNATQLDPNDPTSGTTAEIAMWASDTGSFDDNAVYGNWFHSTESSGRNSVIVIGGDGSSWVGVGGTGNVVYNNTFAGIDEAAVFAMVLLNGSGNTARNNLFYDTVDSNVSATTTSDNDVSLTDIFDDFATLNLRLSEETSPGFTLSAPYDEDPDGNERGSSGTWSVGAFQFDGSPPPPTEGAPNAYGYTARVGNVRAP